jgi:hemin uptake protein HemP
MTLLIKTSTEKTIILSTKDLPAKVIINGKEYTITHTKNGKLIMT